MPSASIEQVIGALLLVVILVLVVALVAQRYLPGANFPWTGEVARLSMVWGTFVIAGIPRGARPHIAIHVVDYVLGRTGAGGRQAARQRRRLGHLPRAAVCDVPVDRRPTSARSPRRPRSRFGSSTAVPIVGFALTALRALLWIPLHDVPALLRPARRRRMTLPLLLDRDPRPVPAARPDGIRDPRAVARCTSSSRTTACTSASGW